MRRDCFAEFIRRESIVLAMELNLDGHYNNESTLITHHSFDYHKSTAIRV